MPYLLLAIDDSAATRHMVEYVADLAPQLRDCKVRLVAIVPNLPSDSQQLAALLDRREQPELHGDEDQHQELVTAQDLLQDFKDQLVAAGLSAAAVSSKILPECLGVAQDLHDEALAHGCDTIVVGRRTAALSHLFGSVSEKLVKKAHPMSVWVIG
ncbi:universal stress protein [bacterium]|nr:universal stress protein [bacterium]